MQQILAEPVIYHTTSFTLPASIGSSGISGVTRVKGQPGQLTKKQLSRRSCEHSWVGWGAAHRNPP